MVDIYKPEAGNGEMSNNKKVVKLINEGHGDAAYCDTCHAYTIYGNSCIVCKTIKASVS